MTSSVRHTDIVNSTAALIPAYSNLIRINGGSDRALEVINRTIIAAEIGAGAGQLKDNTAPNAGLPEGLLFAQFQGACIQNIITSSIKKNAATTHNTWSSFSWGTVAGPLIAKIGWMVINSMQGNGLLISSLYLYDFGTAGAQSIATGDRIEVLLEVGNLPMAVSGATLP